MHIPTPTFRLSNWMIRKIRSISISSGWSIRQIDEQNSFLQGTLSDEIFMTQSTRYAHLHFPKHVCKLQKVLYGLKKAPMAWFSCLSNCLLELGFHGSRSYTFVFIHYSTKFTMYILIYVNDILITCSHKRAIEDLLNTLDCDFAIKDLGSLNFSSILRHSIHCQTYYLNNNKS